MLKVLNIVFRRRFYRGCAVLLIISIMPFMLLPSTFPLSSSPIIEAQASLSTEFTNLSNSTTNSFSPQLAISQSRTQSGNDTVYVVWSDNATGNGDIYFRRSMDNGTSFGNIENLSTNPGNSTAAQIAAYQGNVYVVWTDDSTGSGDIYFKRSVDNGTSFGVTENLSNDNGKSYGAQIVISGNNIYVVWADDSTGNEDIYFKRSVDNGTSFGSTQNLSTNPGNSTAAQIAAYQDNVYVVWEDATTGNGDIYLKASLDNGTKFSGQKVLAKNNGSSSNPQIAVSPNNIIYGIWQDDTPYDRSKNTTSETKSVDILFRVSLDSGRNFTTRNTIGKDIGDSADFVQIAAVHNETAGRINDAHVVWSDILKYRQPFNLEVFYQTIANNGMALSDPINLSNNDGNSTTPKVAVSERNSVYVVWVDESTGNGDIYFTRAN